VDWEGFGGGGGGGGGGLLGLKEVGGEVEREVRSENAIVLALGVGGICGSRA